MEKGCGVYHKVCRKFGWDQCGEKRKSGKPGDGGGLRVGVTVDDTLKSFCSSLTRFLNICNWSFLKMYCTLGTLVT